MSREENPDDVGGCSALCSGLLLPLMMLVMIISMIIIEKVDPEGILTVGVRLMPSSSILPHWLSATLTGVAILLYTGMRWTIGFVKDVLERRQGRR